jgi:GLPGLI family protein
MACSNGAGHYSITIILSKTTNKTFKKKLMKNVKMPLRSLIIVIIILFQNFGYAQWFKSPMKKIEPASLLISYDLHYVKDTTEFDLVRQEEMLLFIGNDYSMFLSYDNYKYDTMVQKMTNDEQFRDFLSSGKMPLSAFQYRIIKNHPEAYITFIEHIAGSGTFKYDEKLPVLDWELSTETDTVTNYLVQKAECDYGGRHWIAWFAPDLPYSDGPYKFSGLPGLILKVYDKQKSFVFEMFALERLSKELYIEIKDKNYNETDRKGFLRAKNSFKG